MLALAVGPSRVLGYYSRVAHLHVGPSSCAGSGPTRCCSRTPPAGSSCRCARRPRLRALASGRPRPGRIRGAGRFARGRPPARGGPLRHQRLAPLPGAVPDHAAAARRARLRPLREARLAGRRGVVLAALLLLALSSRIPLSGFTVADAKQDSPFLFAVFRLEQHLGIENGSLAVALLAAALSLVASGSRSRAAARRSRSVLPSSRRSSARAPRSCSTARRPSTCAPGSAQHGFQWVDRSGLKDVTIFQTQGSNRAAAMEQLFWNRSISRVGLLYGGIAPDAFRADSFRVTERGRLVHRARATRARSCSTASRSSPSSRAPRRSAARRVPALPSRGHTAALAHDLRPLPRRLARARRGDPHLAGGTPGTACAARSASISRFRRTSAPNRPPFGCAPPACAWTSWSGRACTTASRSR